MNVDASQARDAFLGQNPDVAALVERTKLLGAPALVYGKCSSLVNFGEGVVWQEPSEGRLAKLALFGKDRNTLASVAEEQVPYQVIAARNDESFTGERKTAPMGDRSRFFGFFMNETKGRLLQQDLVDGNVSDICVFEQASGDRVTMLYGFKSNSVVSEGRGDFTLFLRLSISNDVADVLKQEISNHPARPYELFQALFPTAFVPSVSVDQVNRAILSGGKEILQREKISDINNKTGLTFVLPNHASMDDLDKNLSQYSHTMSLRMLAATRISRHKPLQAIFLADLRGVNEWTFSMYDKKSSTVLQNAQIIPAN